MVEKKDLLVEIGTEELPPLALSRLSESFQEQFETRLQEHGLAYERVERFATPRRLAIRVSQLDTEQASQTQLRKGPSVKAAFDGEGNATKAAAGFARSCGVEVADLEQEDTPKGAWLVYRFTKIGKKTEELIPDMVKGSLGSLPIPKRMRWGDLNSEFVRPVHWIVLLFGDQPIHANILDVNSGKETRGHRFHHPGKITIHDPSEYDTVLRNKGYVEADFEVRKDLIESITVKEAERNGAKAVIEPKLLGEVTALCEWPVAVMGSFGEEFLQVPAEALIETMQKHQKYFPLVNGRGDLLPKFITISNIESKDQAQVQTGNERVIRPRFKDAAFFWEQDLKRSFSGIAKDLDKVVFQHQLGTLGDKSRRVGRVAAEIGSQVGLDESLAKRSAELCKCDLLTDMVGEFAGLQGIMGRYYANAAGEDKCVASAMEEQYLPRHAGDELPKSLCGQVLAIADRLDSLVGIFAIGQKPTGVKDPYALRRASLGVMRVLIETPLELDLKELLKFSAFTLSEKVDATGAVDEVYAYMMERLYGYYGNKEYSQDVVESVLAVSPPIPFDIDSRIKAVEEFKKLDESAALSAANKRIRNILKKSDQTLQLSVNRELLRETSEQNLFDRLLAIQTELGPLLEGRDYHNALSKLATLRPAVDEFFDNVMVMCENEEVRTNRLALLNSLSAAFKDIADISRLH